jgi:hypothetical protein
LARAQVKPTVEIVLAGRTRLAADTLGQPRGAERKDRRSDRLLERSVPALQLRGDRATVLGLTRHRGAVQQDRRGVVAAVARTGSHRRVEDKEMVAHYVAMDDRLTDVIPVCRIAERV